MTARKFLYICAGLFLLALGFQLGTRDAHSQAIGVDAAMVDGNGACVVINRQMTWFSYGSPPTHVPNPAPGSSRVIACYYNLVLLENGDVYGYSLGSGEWFFKGTLALGPTPALQESWGQLKSRYAPSHAPTSQTPTDR
jgi:hypothetical protein